MKAGMRRESRSRAKTLGPLVAEFSDRFCVYFISFFRLLRERQRERKKNPIIFMLSLFLTRRKPLRNVAADVTVAALAGNYE